MIMEELWPWILPLPKRTREQYEILLSVFKSKVSLDILLNMNVNRKNYQRDLIKKVPHSNKSIISALKKFVQAGIVEQGTEKVKVKGKDVWVNYYKLTFLGKYLKLLLTPIDKLSPRDLRKIVEELFDLYAKSIAKLCFDFNISHEVFHNSLNKLYLTEIVKRVRESRRSVKAVVFGSTAVDLIIPINNIPIKHDQTITICGYIRDVGGSGANVAIALSRLGVPTSFSGKIGGDYGGRIAVERMLDENVDISSIVIGEDLQTPQSIVLVDRNGMKKILVLLGKKPALSLSSPAEVDWSLVDSCETVYIGEVFVEVASAIASYAKSKGKWIVYRPITPFIKMGFKKLEPTIKSANTIILNEINWNQLKESTSAVNEPTDLLNLGPEEIIITKSSKGVEIYTKEGSFEFPPFKVKVVDTTGAGDAFAAGYIKARLDGRSLREAVKYALAVSAITITRLGVGTSLPKVEEVEEFIKENPL